MRTTRTLRRLAVAITGTAVVLAAAAPAAHADTSAVHHHATFTGFVTSDAYGSAGNDPATPRVEDGICEDPTKPLGQCYVEWRLGISLCAVPTGALAGDASYTTRTGNTFTGRIYGTGASGSGIFDGYLAGDLGVVRIHIDASDSCPAAALLSEPGRYVMLKAAGPATTSPGTFSGYVSYF